MDTTLTSNITNKTPYAIFTELNSLNSDGKKTFDLNPPYQRNIVWKTKQYIKFIESIFCGIVPCPIIIALDSKLNKKICVDGKQRLTSIEKFFTNLIPYHKVEENKITLYWFSEIKNDKSIQEILESIYQIKNFENTLITPQMKCWMESRFQLLIIQYADITYEQQIDIFNRIQYGIDISRGSYLKSFITDAKLCEYIVERANVYKGYFGKYIKNENNEDHIKFMVEVFLMLEKKIVNIKNDTTEFELKAMTMKSFKKIDEKYENVIKIMFNSELLNSNSFTKKIIMICLAYAKEKIDNKNFDKNKMKYILEQICDEITEENKRFTKDDLLKFIDDHWNDKPKKIHKTVSSKKTIEKLVNKKKVQIEQESDESDNSDDSGDSDDEELN
jgi:hypothetical protein